MVANNKHTAPMSASTSPTPGPAASQAKRGASYVKNNFSSGGLEAPKRRRRGRRGLGQPIVGRVERNEGLGRAYRRARAARHAGAWVDRDAVVLDRNGVRDADIDALRAGRMAVSHRDAAFLDRQNRLSLKRFGHIDDIGKIRHVHTPLCARRRKAPHGNSSSSHARASAHRAASPPAPCPRAHAALRACSR